MSSGVYPYDRVPFRSPSVPAADCRRIELIARLFGLTAAPSAQARVLELGCGTAANLIPLALAHPRACFIGCDLSRSALASAQRIIEGLGLTNVELRHVDICDVDDGWGSFDYILCQDVFSWVAPGDSAKDPGHPEAQSGSSRGWLRLLRLRCRDGASTESPAT